MKAKAPQTAPASPSLAAHEETAREGVPTPSAESVEPSEPTLDGAHFVASNEDADEMIEEIDVTDVIDLTESSDQLDLADGELAEGTLDAQDELAAQGGETVEAAAEAGMEERPSRKRLEEQLEALKRKESELRRALVIADHPELGDAIRVLQGRAYAIGRVETKLAQGLSKSEERRRETLDKKLGLLRGKRSELDAQIGALEAELTALGAERTAAFEQERKEALELLLIALGTHEPALRAAGIDASTLVPELTQWLPEIEGLAEQLVSARGDVEPLSEVASPLPLPAPTHLERDAARASDASDTPPPAG